MAAGDFVRPGLEVGRLVVGGPKAEAEALRLTPAVGDETVVPGGCVEADNPAWALVPNGLGDEEPRPRSAEKGRGTTRLGKDRSSRYSTDRRPIGSNLGWRRVWSKDGRPRKACRKERRNDMEHLPKKCQIRKVLSSAVAAGIGPRSHAQGVVVPSLENKTF